MADGHDARQVTTYFCARGASEAIEFYKRAFDAEERSRLPRPDGTLGHAEIQIGATTLMLSDEAPDLGVFSPATLKGNSVSFVLAVADADAAFERAVSAGARVERPLRDEPYGRVGWVVDPFGHRWALEAPNPDVDPARME
jgi:PhnB protein